MKERNPLNMTPARARALKLLLEHRDLNSERFAEKFWPDRKWRGGPSRGGPSDANVAGTFFLHKLLHGGWLGHISTRPFKWDYPVTRQWHVTALGQQKLREYEQALADAEASQPKEKKRCRRKSTGSGTTS